MEENRRKDDGRIDALFLEVQDLKRLIETTNKNTAEIVEFWGNLQAGIKVLGWLGKVAKWVAAIAAGISAIYAIKTGVTKP